ncbi:MAG: TolC family protein [Magnetococcales bacterium]|nr:TolC family protein [Magnetococcales bacterium]
MIFRVFLVSFTLLLVSLLQAADGKVDFEEVLYWASEHNPSYLAAQARYRAVREQSEQTLGRLLPEVNARWSYTNTVDSGQISNRNNASTSEKLEARQSLIDLVRYKQHRQAELAVQSAEQDALLAEQTLLKQVADTALQVLQARELLVIANDKKEMFRKNEENTKYRYEKGELTRTDLHQAATRHASAAAEFIETNRQLYNAEHQFRELVKAALPETVDIPEPYQNSSKFLEEQIWPELPWDHWIEQRPDVLAANYRQQEAELKVEAGEAGHWPTVTASAGINRIRDHGPTSSSAIYGDPYLEKNVLVEMTLPLYAGGQTVSRARQAKSELEVQVQEVDRVKQAARRELDQAKENRHAVGLALISYERAVNEARQAMEGMEEEFRVGTRTATDLMDTQSAYFQTLADATRSRFNYRLAAYELAKASGLIALPK